MGLLRRRWILAPVLLAICLGVGAVFAISLGANLPAVEALRDWRPSTVTTMYAADGSVITRIGEEKRIVIEYSKVPKRFIDAIVATEDAHFYHHIGVDPLGIARAVLSNVTSMRWGTQGGSTITQQLARNLFLKPDKTMSRKLQEAILAMRIERQYTKEEILTFYCNQVYLGHGRYGIEAAAEFYFSHPARELTTSQCALLAGVVQAPELLSPIRHPDRALKRRAHVIDRLKEEGYITPAEAEAATKEPLGLAPGGEGQAPAPYFIEEVRRYLLQKYGEEALYRDGLSVETTLDPSVQKAAEESVRDGVLELDRRRGFRRKWKTVGGHGSLQTYRDPGWPTGAPDVGKVVPGLVISASSTSAELRVGDYRVLLERSAIEWSGRTALVAVMRPGDLVPLRITGRNETAKRLTAEVVPSPDVEGALVAIEPATGEIRALVGGFDFQRSEFDRAVQARRQAGSAFKPFLFSAAIDAGMTPSATLFDEPTVLLDPQTNQPYQPENYYRKYYGLTTLRQALEESRNIVSVLLLDRVGYRPVIERAKAMGITTPLAPYPSMALGSFEVSPLEMTSAYTVFANQGVRVEPHFLRRVRDRDGNVLEQTKPVVTEVMKPETAFVTTWLLKGVAEEGTAAKARSLGRPIAGKTGTTDDYSDAWFIGFTPSLACGVWVGTDRRETLGKGETGAEAALPIWISFFEKALAGKPPEEFVRPSGVDLVPVDRNTGLRAGAETPCDPANIILESFVSGTEPTVWCSAAEHFRLTLPYFLQKFRVNEKLELVADPEALAEVIRAGPRSVTLAADARSLDADAGEVRVHVPLALDADGGRQLQRALASPPAPPSELTTSLWYGLDGRVAAVRVIHRD